MADPDAKRKLLDCLDETAFQPVLRADAEDYPEDKRDVLRDVQRATRSERDRFRGYDTAEKVVDMFRDDLSSEPAQKIQRELHDLDLPTLGDVRDEFENLARDLGVAH